MKQQFKVVTKKINLIYTKDKRSQELASRSKYNFYEKLLLFTRRLDACI